MAQPSIWRNAGWWLLQLLALAALGYAVWRLIGRTPYRIDVDVYRMGGQAWLDGHPLYSHDAKFHTPIGLNLPFTYPPLAAVIFCPFAWLGMPAASVTITLITLALLLVSTMIVLTRLDVWNTTRAVPGPAWLRRWLLTAFIVAAAALWLEPIESTFAFGQINVVLMTLVIADCVPRRTPWPRGLLLGLGIALKLTPAVFLLYFLLRRDRRAVFTSLASFAAATAAGFVLAWHDSVSYWTSVVYQTGRIGDPVIAANQCIQGVLARAGLDPHSLPGAGAWLALSVLVVMVAWHGMRRALAASQECWALALNAFAALLISPMSWSHHWVWCAPALLILADLGRRHRNRLAVAAAAIGLFLFITAPQWWLGELAGPEQKWAAWQQAIGSSYVLFAALLLILSAWGKLTPPTPADRAAGRLTRAAAPAAAAAAAAVGGGGSRRP